MGVAVAAEAAYFYNKGVTTRAQELPNEDHSKMYNPLIMLKERHPKLTPEEQYAHDKALEPEHRVDKLRGAVLDSLKKEVKHDAHSIVMAVKV